MTRWLLLIGFVFSASNALASPYEDVLAEMRSIQNQYPALVQLLAIGQNDQGEKIWGMQIELPLTEAKGEGRTSHLVVAAHHGNETRSVPSAIEYTRQLLNALSNPNDAFFPAFSAKRFFIIPVLNIGGYNSTNREERDQGGQSHDPNRDYPDPCDKAKSDFQLKSTKVLAEFMRQRNIVSAVTVHGYIGTFTYPWGTYTDQPRTPDDQTFSDILSPTTKINHYHTGTHGELIYPTVGAFEDWAYYELGVWVALLEIESENNYSADAQAMMQYFSTVPVERSRLHSHLGQCLNLELLPASVRNRSRP